MKDTNLLPLSKLIITGERHYTSNDDIRQAILALKKIGTFITQDVNIIQRQIEHIPWIKQVHVRKQWPDELKIHLIEYVPVAYWNDQYLLDYSGQVFSLPMARTNNLPIPMFYGPKGSEQDILNGYRNMNTMLKAAKFQLKTVSMNARHSWQLILQDNTRLELGRNNKIKRLKLFLRLYPILLQQAKNDNKHINYVDLRYDSGLAVSWATGYIKQENSDQQQT